MKSSTNSVFQLPRYFPLEALKLKDGGKVVTNRDIQESICVVLETIFDIRPKDKSKGMKENSKSSATGRVTWQGCKVEAVRVTKL